MEYRECPRCKQLKPHSAFAEDPRTKSGVSSYCLECRRLLTKDWRRRKLEENPTYFRDIYRANPEHGRERSKRWRERHKEKVKERQRELYWQNPTPHRERCLRWSRTHKDYRREQRFLYGRMWTARNGKKRPIAGFLKTQGFCLFCGDTNPLLLQNAHVFKDDHDLLISLCPNCHWLLDHYPMGLNL